MEPERTEAREALKPRFIFGPLGNGYRLTKTQFWIVDAIGLSFLAPGIALALLAKMDVITAMWGVGGIGASMILAVTAMKIYVSAKDVPQVARRKAAERREDSPE